MGGTVLTLLCLWSCILQVTPLTEVDVGRAVKFFEQQIFKGYRNQYAYFVKFTAQECYGGLEDNDLQAAMNQINAAEVIRKVRKRNEIYEGARMVAAAPRDVTLPNGRIVTEHSEFRLLSPDNNSPISRLLAPDPPAGCVLFFSLNSPCVGICTALGGTYNIIDKLNKLKRLPNNLQDRAFSFRKVFHYDKNKDPQTVWNNWKYLNTVMNLYRNNLSIKCVDNGVQNNNCLNQT